MLRSLLLQLLIVWPRGPWNPAPNLAFIANDPELEEDVTAHDALALCLVFEVLLGQLPRGTKVYLILDDVARFEPRSCEWRESLRKLWRD